MVKCEWQNGFNPDKKRGTGLMRMGQDQCRHWCWGVQMGLNKRHSFNLGSMPQYLRLKYMPLRHM